MTAGNLSSFLQHPLNRSLFRCYPPPVTSLYIRQLGRLYFRRYPQERDRYVMPLRAILGTSGTDTSTVDRLTAQMLCGVFDHYFEKLLNAYWGFTRMRRLLRRRVTMVHRDLLDDALMEGRGLILTTAHFGAVEFLPAALAFRGYPVTMAVRFQTARLKKTLSDLAFRAGIDLLDPGAGPILPLALSSLRQGRIFIYELDEISRWKPSPRKVMTFFGRRVRLDRTVEIIQKRAGSPLLLGLMERTGRRQYQLVLERPCEHVPAPTGLGQDAQLLKRLEHYIYSRPDHWYLWKDLHRLEPMAVR